MILLLDSNSWSFRIFEWRGIPGMNFHQSDSKIPLRNERLAGNIFQGMSRIPKQTIMWKSSSFFSILTTLCVYYKRKSNWFPIRKKNCKGIVQKLRSFSLKFESNRIFKAFSSISTKFLDFLNFWDAPCHWKITFSLVFVFFLEKIPFICINKRLFSLLLSVLTEDKNRNFQTDEKRLSLHEELLISFFSFSIWGEINFKKFSSRFN